MIALLAFGPELTGIGMPSVGHLATHLAALQMPMALIDSTFSIGFGINGPLWLLSIVVTFYALLPFVARPYFRHPLAGLAIAAAVTIVWKQTVEWAPDFFRASRAGPAAVVGLAVDQFPGWAFSFGLGMTAAWAHELAVERYPRELLNRTAVRALAVVLPAYALVAYLAGRHAFTVGGNVGMVVRQETFEAMLQSGLRAAVILVVILGPIWMLRPFVNRTTRWLAELSYGVYLIHWVIVIYLHEYSRLPTNGTVADLALWMAVVLPPRSCSRRSRGAGSSCRFSAGCYAGRPPRRRSEALNRQTSRLGRRTGRARPPVSAYRPAGPGTGIVAIHEHLCDHRRGRVPGSHLSERLLAEGHRVICLDNLDTGSLLNISHIRANGFEFRNVDITEPVSIDEPVTSSTTSPPPPRRSTTRACPCTRSRSAPTGPTTCSASPSSSGRGSCSPRPRRSTATRRSTRNRRATGGTSTRSGHAASTTRPSATRRH